MVGVADALAVPIFLLLVFGVGALILFAVDKATLGDKSGPERELAVRARTERMRSRWLYARFLMAVAAMLVMSLDAKELPRNERIVFFTLAALYALSYLRFLPGWIGRWL